MLVYVNKNTELATVKRGELRYVLFKKKQQLLSPESRREVIHKE